MSRLDRHVSLVRTKLATATFLGALAWALAGFFALCLAAVLVDRLLLWRLPHWRIWACTGLGLSVAGAIARSMYCRPTPRQAAVAIDQRLGLSEKFSTALYVRPSVDPFAMAAVRDAENTADHVSLHRRFPIHWPRALIATALVMAVALLTGTFMGPHPLFGHDAAAANSIQIERHQKDLAEIQKLLDNAIATIDSIPRTEENKAAIELARLELGRFKYNPKLIVPAKGDSTIQAIEKIEQIKDKINAAGKYALTKKDTEIFKPLGSPKDPNSPVGKVQKDIAEGKYDEAAKDLTGPLGIHDTMSKEEKEQAAKEMGELADKLGQVAKDSSKLDELEKRLQDAGADAQQAKKLAELAKQAAAGDPQAGRQAEQLANQIAQNLNANPNLTPQQQQKNGQQVQNLARQLQGAANNQAAAQKLANAAGQLAQAMNQKGQGAAGQVAAGQQMKQALGQLQQAADGADPGTAGKDEGIGPGDNVAQNPVAGQPGVQRPAPVAQVPVPPGGQGPGNNGVGGERPKAAEAPFGVKTEQSPSQTINEGKIIASSFVKSPSERGTSKVELKDVIQSAQKEATDEVEQDRISRPAQKAVRSYFDNLRQ